MINTITLNPSLDVTLWLDRLDPSEPVKARRERTDPAGKAVNVSRVLTALGIPNRLYGVVGADSARQFRALLRECGVAHELLEVPGAVRENLSLVLEDGTLYKVDRAGFSLSREQLAAFSAHLAKAVFQAFPPQSEGDFATEGGDAGWGSGPLMVFAGSLPPGMTSRGYRELILSFRARGARIVLDNAFWTEEDLRIIRPFAIKPNELEFRRLVGEKLDDPHQLLKRAEQLTDAVTHVLVSLGGKGLLYAGAGGRMSAAVPAVAVKSPVGAGDSTLAGFLAALEAGCALPESLRFAAACGTAAVCAEGTSTIRRAAAEAVYPKVTVKMEAAGN